MKKIIPSFFFAIAVSSSFLFAQNNNRLKAEGYRLEEEKNQGIDNRKAELPLEDLIAQGGEITTNYELPTTNCDNSAGSLNCHLMMDPKILQERAVALKERLECVAQQPPLLDRATGGITAEAVSAVSSESNSSISQLPSTVIAATSPTSHLLPVTSPRPVSRRFNSCAWGIFLHNALEGANKTLADLHIDVVAARYKGKHISEAWAKIIPTAERVVQYIRNCLADYYSYNIYPQGLAAIDRAEEALKLRIKEAKNMEKWNSRTYSITADAMESAAKYMVNSLLAEKAAHKFLAENWIQAFQLSIAENKNSSLHIGVVAKKEKPSKESSDRRSAYYNNSSRSKSDKLLPSPQSIQNAKDFLAHAVSYTAYAAEARTKNFQNLVDLWNQAAEQSGIACVNQVKANLFYSSKNKAKAQSLEKTVASAVQERDYFATIAEYTTNAFQAKATGNQELFDFWTLGAKQFQITGKNGLQIVSAQTIKDRKNGRISNLPKQNKEEDSSSEENVGISNPMGYNKTISLYDLAHKSVNSIDVKKLVDGYIARAAKAQAVGNQNLADLWMHAARQVQMLYEINVQPIRSHIDKIYDAHFGKEDESDEERSFVANPFHQYGGAVDDFVKSVKQADDELDKVSEYKAQATEARILGNQEIAELWSQAAIHIQTAAENSAQIAFARINNNWNEIYRLMDVAKSARKTAHHFTKLADYTVQATNSEVKGNQEIADIWKLVISKTQMAEKNRITAHQALVGGNIDKAKRIEGTSYQARNIINDLIKSVEVITNRLALVDYALLKANKITENRPLSKLAYAEEVELGKRSSEKIADCWRQIAKHYKNAAKHGSSIAHCYKNEDVDNNLLKDKVRELEEASRREESAAERIFGFIYNLEEVEGYKNKALTAKLQGNQELEKAWNNLAEQTQVIADLYHRAAEARDINNNWQECQKISKQAEIEEKEIPILLDIADYLAQAVNAKLAGNQDAANMWVQGARELEKSRQYPSDMDNIKHLFKDTHMSRSTNNGLHFPRLVLERNCSAIRRSAKSRGSILALAAGYAMKAQENMTLGNQKLAYWWTQVLQQSQQTVHYEDQSAQAFINGNEDEANFLGQAAIASWNATKTIVKIAENYENHQNDLLHLNQHINQSQSSITSVGQLVTSDLLEERVKQFQIAAERYSKAALCRSVDNYIASDLWAQAAKQVEIANETMQSFFHQLHDNFLDNNDRASDFSRSIGDELARVAAVFEGFNLETGIETGDLSQYTLSQNIFSEPLRTVKVCSGSVKTILEQNPYEISSSSIPVSRFKVENRNEMNPPVQDVVSLFVKAAEYSANARIARASIPTQNARAARGSLPRQNEEEDSSSEEDSANARTARGSIPKQNTEEDSSSEEEFDASNLIWSKKLVTVQNAPPQEVDSERLQKLASLWDKAARQSQVAAKSKAKEVMATMGQNNYNAYLIVTAETLQDSANKFAQAAEAFAAGNETASDVLAQAAERQSQRADKQKSKGSHNAVNRGIDHDFE